MHIKSIRTYRLTWIVLKVIKDIYLENCCIFKDMGYSDPESMWSGIYILIVLIFWD